MIHSFISITAASGLPLFVLQTLPDYGLVVGAEHDLRKSDKKLHENTLNPLQNEFIPSLKRLRINVDVFYLFVPRQLSGYLRTTSISQADGAAFIWGNYVCCVNSAFLDCSINPKPLK